MRFCDLMAHSGVAGASRFTFGTGSSMWRILPLPSLSYFGAVRMVPYGSSKSLCVPRGADR